MSKDLQPVGESQDPVAHVQAGAAARTKEFPGFGPHPMRFTISVDSTPEWEQALAGRAES